MLKYVGVKCLDTLELPCEKKRGKWKNSSIPDAKKVCVFATDDNLFVTHTGGLVIQHLIKNPTQEHTKTENNIQTISDHESLITCVGFSENESLVCTCSDESVILRKRDLNQWDSYAIGECFGRIQSCTIVTQHRIMYIFLAKLEEIIVLQAVSSYASVEPGPLDVVQLELFLTAKKVKESINWLRSVTLGNTIYIVGLSLGNGISLKMWEFVPEERKLKMVTQQTASNGIKSIVSIDMKTHNGFCYLLLIDQTGYVEIYNVNSTRFCLINRLNIEENSCKIIHDESLLNATTNNTMNLSTNPIGNIKIEFRVLSAQFFFKDPPVTPITAFEEDLGEGCTGDGLPPLDNSLSMPSFQSSSKFPKLSFIVAISNKILFVDGKSGESQVLVEYEEFVKSNNLMVNNAKLSINSEYGEILISIQPMLQKHIFTFRLCLDLSDYEEYNTENFICSLVPNDVLHNRSILRKKLKSPPTVVPLHGRRHSLMKVNNFYIRCLEEPRPVHARASLSFSHRQTLFRRSPLPSGESRKGTIKAVDFETPMSSRSMKVVPKGSYIKDFEFCEKSLQCLPGRLSEDLCFMRMAATKDGKALAVGGNKSPVLVAKTVPAFEQIHTFKDIAHLTSLSFSFSSKYLLIATNDCKSIVVDWKTGKEILNFQFTSKFNEHIHSQFYFMDKFILQPEERQIVLYSYAVRPSGNIKVKAGAFPLRCQSITSIAAANQFLSNIIITGQSNKCIEVFDANVEQVVVSIPNCHVKPVSCIRLNEAPKGYCANELCNIFMTSCPSYLDPIKIWDLRTARCIIRLSDLSGQGYIPTSRPSLSPCGRYIASGLEENSLTLYDIRKINSRVCTLRNTHSSVLDCVFDPSYPVLWCGCKNGTLWLAN